MCPGLKKFSKIFNYFVRTAQKHKKTLRNLTTAEGKKFRFGGNARESFDYGSPPPAAAAAHLTSASMVPDFSPVLELT